MKWATFEAIKGWKAIKEGVSRKVRKDVKSVLTEPSPCETERVCGNKRRDEIEEGNG